LGGAFPSFAEVVRSKGSITLQFSPIERRELDFLLVVRLAASEEVTLALDCSVLEKTTSGKDLVLGLQSKGHLARSPSAQGVQGSTRKSLLRLNLRTWRNFLVRLVGRVIDGPLVWFWARL
jgi:hypothetical protein